MIRKKKNEFFFFVNKQLKLCSRHANKNPKRGWIQAEYNITKRKEQCYRDFLYHKTVEHYDGEVTGDLMNWLYLLNFLGMMMWSSGW